MSKRIVLDDRVKRQEIMNLFKVTHPTLRSALNFTTNSGLAKILRAAAIQRGGLIIDGNKIQSVFDTYFTEDPHRMIQSFGDSVQLVVSVLEDSAAIVVNGKVVESYSEVKMSDIPRLQLRAKVVVEELNSQNNECHGEN